MPYGVGVGMQGALGHARLEEAAKQRLEQNIGGGMDRQRESAFAAFQKISAMKQARDERMEKEREKADILNVLDGGRPTTAKGALLKSEEDRKKQRDAMDAMKLMDSQNLAGRRQDFIEQQAGIENDLASQRAALAALELFNNEVQQRTENDLARSREARLQGVADASGAAAEKGPQAKMTFAQAMTASRQMLPDGSPQDQVDLAHALMQGRAGPLRNAMPGLNLFGNTAGFAPRGKLGASQATPESERLSGTDEELRARLAEIRRQQGR